MKEILKDHLILVADSMTYTSIKKRKGFNNAGYKATFRSLKVQMQRSPPCYPYEMLEETAERCHPDSLGCVVSSCSWGKHASPGTKSSIEILGTKIS